MSKLFQYFGFDSDTVCSDIERQHTFDRNDCLIFCTPGFVDNRVTAFGDNTDFERRLDIWRLGGFTPLAIFDKMMYLPASSGAVS